MEEQDNIGRLFREKLGNAELIPSPEFKADLMRKAGRREFFRFNPARFNIYYLSILLIAIAAALVLITGNKGNKEEKPQLPVSDFKQIPDTNRPSDLPERISTSSNSVKYHYDLKNQDTGSAGKGRINTKNVIASDVKSGSQDTISSSPVDIFSIRSLFNGKSSERQELQGAITLTDGLILASSSEGCAPLKIKFSCKPGSFDSYQWSFDDEGSSVAKEPEWTFNNDGDFKVKLSVKRSDGIYLISYADIRVHPRPVARFEIRTAAKDQDDNEIKFINYSMNAARFRWSFGDGSTSELFEPAYRYSKSGIYNVMLIAASEYGCSDSLAVKNAFTYNYFINFPNAFIPNAGGPTGGYYSTKSDETAEVFHPVFSGVSEYELKVYSKIGILMFETNDINIGWDGYFKGQLSEPGVYVWKVRGSFMNGEQFIRNGDVTLLKK